MYETVGHHVNKKSLNQWLRVGPKTEMDRREQEWQKTNGKRRKKATKS